MPKIDTTKIENYANMTAEEKVKAFEAYEFEVDNSDVERLKTAVSKANSEAAEWKKKHNALLSEEERKEAERLEAQQAIEKEIAELRKEKTVTENKAQFISLGYDEKLAGETANALADGNLSKVFENQKIFLEQIKKVQRAEALAGASEPPAGTGKTAAMTKEQFNALEYHERLKLFQEKPELYKQLTEETN